MVCAEGDLEAPFRDRDAPASFTIDVLFNAHQCARFGRTRVRASQRDSSLRDRVFLVFSLCGRSTLSVIICFVSAIACGEGGSE